jgi:ATP-dependent RNA helicase RhlE
MTMDFQHFGLHEAVVHGVQSMGYSEPTPIQSRSIPIVLSGGDLMGSAQTGTGKTAAFALPLLSKLEKHGKLRCLVLEPTRELASQVEEAFKAYSRFFDVEVGMVQGGVGFGSQKAMIERGVDVLVATPGRLLDFMQEGIINLDHIEYLVLDEVDRMLDMGFLPQVRRIVERCPKNRQTLFFSATLPPEIESLTKWVLKDPEVISIGERRSPAETVTHALYPVARDQKFDLLLALLDKTQYHSVIVFTATKMMADRVAARLEELKHPVAAMHADRSQKERVEALEGFKSGKFEVLVATDVAARGLDIASVSHVINYDVPGHPEDYVHRIGRTGRAQQEGDAFTLFTAEELDQVRAIERYISTSIPRCKLEGFPYLYTTLFNESSIPQGGAARGGRTLKGYSFSARKRK